MLRLAKKGAVPLPVLDRVRRRLTRRLLRACTAADPRWGFYHQFAITMMKSYQDLLADLGLVGYWVVRMLSRHDRSRERAGTGDTRCRVIEAELEPTRHPGPLPQDGNHGAHRAALP